MLVNNKEVRVVLKGKGVKVGRPVFGKVFSSVNSFYARVDYTKAHVLGEVDEAEESHDGVLIHRMEHRRLPKGSGVVNLVFIQPWKRDMSLGQAFKLMMDFGFRPAIHHEVVVSLKTASQDQIMGLFEQADKVNKVHGRSPVKGSLSVACLGSAVIGKTGELIPVQEVVWAPNPLCRLQLRKLDFDASMPPAQSIAFVSV